MTVTLSNLGIPCRKCGYMQTSHFHGRPTCDSYTPVPTLEVHSQNDARSTALEEVRMTGDLGKLVRWVEILGELRPWPNIVKLKVGR